ncbi:MAG: phage terminase large subunit [Hyphomonadaceae bacterium]|nr:phage terminase large subunit [Hyphomonadaceae bacterium]
MSTPTLTAAHLDAVLRHDLTSFTAKTFELLHPGTALEPAWHVEAMTHALGEVYEARTRRLLITVPPRHLKTICSSVSFCAWALGKRPDLKFLVASYGDALARRTARDFRTVMQSPLYRRLFPHVGARLQDNELEFVTNQNGGRRAVSRGGALTGFGADIIIVDDIMKADDCRSATERQQVKDFYEGTLFSRLNDKRDGRIVVVQQRLHEDDLPGYLLEKGGFTHLNLPAIAPIERTYALGYGRTKSVEPGELLCPARESQAELEELRVEMGAANFAAQYLQDPASGHSDTFKWSSIRFYDEAPASDDCDLVVQSWDTAAKINANNDYSACSTWGFHRGVWKLLDVVRGRWEYPDLYQLAHAHRKRWHARLVLIEDSSNGIALVQQLRQDILRLTKPRCDPPWRVVAYAPKVAKAVRLATQTVRLEQGEFLFPAQAPFLDELKREMVTFGHAKHDDQVDSVTQFMAWASAPSGQRAIRATAERRAKRDAMRA